MNETRFALRLIKNGRVKIHGTYYKPNEQHKKYDSRLDGMRCAFGLYRNAEGKIYSICLWGTEEQYRANVEEYKKLWPGPTCIDGVSVWEWWRPTEGNNK